MLDKCYKFKLPELPYDYDSLEPYIDEETMIIHHNKHFKTYIDNLNKVLEENPKYQSWSLRKLIVDNKMLPLKIQTNVKNNAGGVYNHYLYFNMMTPNSTLEPIGLLKKAIDMSFGSFDLFKKEFKEKAFSQFGSGWAWLVVNKYGKLCIVKTNNQDTPLIKNLCPILLIDVWEHAYYLKYQNRRMEYIENWFNLVDWEQAEVNYLKNKNNNWKVR